MASLVEQGTGRVINYVDTKVSNALSGMVDKALDNFVINAEQNCLKRAKQNSLFEFLGKRSGLNAIAGGLKDMFSKNLAKTLANSPLRRMAEDVLAETINKYARTLSQNILSIIPKQFTKTLKDVRALAFSAVFTTLTFQNNMALFFVAKIAEETLKALADKRRTLIALRDAAIKLHNALIQIGGSGPFFDQYLAQLKQALELIIDAEYELGIVQVKYTKDEIFFVERFNGAKKNLDSAYEIMLPKIESSPVKPDASLLDKLLHDLPVKIDYQKQLTLLLQIPKFSMELLGAYDLYALKTLKVNTLLTGFLSAIQNLSMVQQGHNKDLTLQQLKNAREGLKDIVGTMSTSLYGGPGDGPDFQPSSSLVTAKAVTWAVRVKAINIMLEVIDPVAISGVQISNTALMSYNQAVVSLEQLNDVQRGTAILRANAGREEVLGVESIILTFAFQANQAILSSAMLGKTKYDPNTVLAMGKKLIDRLDLSLEQDRQVEMILSGFIYENKKAINSQRNLGNSLFAVLDDLGLDRASDFLKRGAFGEFFSLTGSTATYVGAAVAGLSLLQKGLGSQTQRDCITRAIDTLKTEDMSKRLDAQMNVQNSYPRQQLLNERACNDAQAEVARVKACSSGVDIGLLFSHPMAGLQAAFTGVFGENVSDALKGTFGDFGEVVSTGLGDIPGKITSITKGTSGVFNNDRYMSNAIKDASEFAGKLTAAAKSATSKVTDAINSAKATADAAKQAVSDKVTDAINSAKATADAAKQAVSDKVTDAINSAKDTADAAKQAVSDKVGEVVGSVTDKLGEAELSLKDSIGTAVGKSDILDARVLEDQAAAARNAVDKLVSSQKLIDNPFADV